MRSFGHRRERLLSSNALGMEYAIVAVQEGPFYPHTVMGRGIRCCLGTGDRCFYTQTLVEKAARDRLRVRGVSFPCLKAAKMVDAPLGRKDDCRRMAPTEFSHAKGRLWTTGPAVELSAVLGAGFPRGSAEPVIAGHRIFLYITVCEERNGAPGDCNGSEAVSAILPQARKYKGIPRKIAGKHHETDRETSVRFRGKHLDVNRLTRPDGPSSGWQLTYSRCTVGNCDGTATLSRRGVRPIQGVNQL